GNTAMVLVDRLGAASPAFWEDLVRSLPEAITVTISDGTILYANEPAARICGYESVAALMDAGSADVWARNQILDDAGRPITRDELPNRRMLREGEEESSAIVHYRNLASDEEKWTDVRSRLLRTSDDSEPLLLHVFHDVTTQVRDQQKLSFLAEASDLLSQSL